MAFAGHKGFFVNFTKKLIICASIMGVKCKPEYNIDSILKNFVPYCDMRIKALCKAP
jgi:hypothetical protein